LFLSIVTLIVVTPGPNLFMLLGVGGRRATGFLAVLGICAAILSHVTLALVGVGAIIATSALLFTALKVAGAAYLIWMGLKSLWSLRQGGGLSVPMPAASAPPTGGRAFAMGYLTNILNPKPAIFYVAAFPQFLQAGEPGFYATGYALGLAHAGVAFSFYALVVLMMGQLTRVLLRPMVARAVKAVSGVALVLLGGRLLLARSPA
ncbi:LysE family translocator, partial [Teichococcus deserti]|uniref:LysE family translocator n=1 Tax=Teichococcus deserti TaxID=1817963 RepID=UPI001A979BAE